MNGTKRFWPPARHTHVRVYLCVLVVVCAVAASAADADKLFKQARKAEEAGRMAEAYLLYSHAAALAPEKPDYLLHAQAVQSRAGMEAKVRPGVTAFPSEPEPESRTVEDFLALATPEDLAEARKPLPPAELKPLAGRRDFDLKGNARNLFEQVAREFGLDTVFDGDYEDAGREIRFRMNEVDHAEALHALEAVTGSFIVPLSEKLFLVAKDTPQKRNDVEPYISLTVDVSEPTTTQDMVALVTAVQQSLALEKVAWDTQKSAVVIRDKISKAWPARQLFHFLLYPRAQVELELEFLEVNRSDSLSYGLSLPTSFPVVALTRVLNNQISIPQGIRGLATFGGGSSLFGIGIVDAQLVARMSKSHAQTLLRSQVRSIDSQPAEFHVGDRFPVLTGGYFGEIEDDSGEVYRPPPSFQFEDLGLALKVTPKVHGAEEVSLDVDSEFKVLAGQGINGIPIISNRKLTTRVRLRFGEWAVVGGIMTASEARTISGLAGLSRVPVIGRLLRSNTNTDDDKAILVIVKPRLLTLPPDQYVTRTLRVGAETRPLTPM